MDRIRGRIADDGITLVEIVVAFSVLMITMVPVGYLLDSSVAGANNARQKEAALQLADSWLEILTNSSPPTQGNGEVITSGCTAPIAPPGAITPHSSTGNYSVCADYQLETVNNETGKASSDFCSDGEPPSPSHPAVIQLQVQVSWGSGGPNETVTDTTNIDYPQPGLQTEGYISLQLTNDGLLDTYGNSAATRLEAIPVNITPQGGSAYSPFYADQNGCFFAELPTGNYTVSLGQPTVAPPFVGYAGTPPFVTSGGSSTDSSGANAVTVTVAAEQTVQLSGGDAFDEGITTVNADGTGALSYGGGTAVDGGISCPGTTNISCLSTGDGASGASAAWGGSSSTWSSATLHSVSHLNQVACTSGSSPTCVGVGYSNAGGTNVGEIVTTSNFSSTTTAAIPSGIADVNRVVCPSSDGCYAIATTTAGNPTLLAGAVSQDVWTVVTPTTWSGTAPSSTTFTGLSSIGCPTSSTCEISGSAIFGSASQTPVILRLDGDPASLATNSSWTPTFTSDVVPADAMSFGRITCPDSSQCLVLGTGDSSSATDPTVFTAPISSGSGDASTWINDTFPAGSNSITSISCTSTTCVAIGTMPGTSSPTAAVWTGSLAGNGSSDQWQQATTFPSVASVSQVACGEPANGDTADCELTAVTSSIASELVEGSLAASGSWIWNTSAGPSGSVVEYYTGLACEGATSGQSTCAASGVTASGPVILTSASGPAGTWTTETPSFSGATVKGIPLEITPSSEVNWTNPVPYVPAATTNATSLPGTFYPYANGYSIAAGDCAAEAESTGAATSLFASPGGVASATIPLGLVALQVEASNGSPLNGGTVTLQGATSGCAADQYTLPLTDAQGISRVAVPYGTYTLSATAGTTTVPPSGTTVTLQVSANAITVTTSTSSTSVATTTFLPKTAQV